MLVESNQRELGGQPPEPLHMPDIASNIGKRVAQRRTELQLTQDAMIKQLNHFSGGDWGRSSASVWENGHAEPSVSTIYALAKVLGTRPEYLAYGVVALVSANQGPARNVPVPRSGSTGTPGTAKRGGIVDTHYGLPKRHRPFHKSRSYRRFAAVSSR